MPRLPPYRVVLYRETVGGRTYGALLAPAEVEPFLKDLLQRFGEHAKKSAVLVRGDVVGLELEPPRMTEPTVKFGTPRAPTPKKKKERRPAATAPVPEPMTSADAAAPKRQRRKKTPAPTLFPKEDDAAVPDAG